MVQAGLGAEVRAEALGLLLHGVGDRLELAPDGEPERVVLRVVLAVLFVGLEVAFEEGFGHRWESLAASLGEDDSGPLGWGNPSRDQQADSPGCRVVGALFPAEQALTAPVGDDQGRERTFNAHRSDGEWWAVQESNLRLRPCDPVW